MAPGLLSRLSLFQRHPPLRFTIHRATYLRYFRISHTLHPRSRLLILPRHSMQIRFLLPSKLGISSISEGTASRKVRSPIRQDGIGHIRTSGQSMPRWKKQTSLFRLGRTPTLSRPMQWGLPMVLVAGRTAQVREYPFAAQYFNLNFFHRRFIQAFRNSISFVCHSTHALLLR